MISDETTEGDELLRKSMRKSRIATVMGQEQTACLLVLFAQVFWVCSFIYPNEHNFSAFETMLVRGIAVMVMNMLACYYYKFDLDFKPSKVSLLSLNKRNITMAVHGVMCAFVQFFLPLPVVHIISCSGSIFVCLADYLENGVNLNKAQWKGMIVGLLGIMLVINDKLLLKWLGFEVSQESEFQNYHSKDIWVTTGLSLAFLGIMAVWGFAVVETKKIHNTNTFQINYHQGICIIIFSALFYPFLDSTASIKEILIALLVQGIPMNIAQLMFIGGLTMSKQHGKLSIITFFSVIVAYFLSIFRYHQPVNWVALAGTVMASFGVIKCLLNKG